MTRNGKPSTPEEDMALLLYRDLLEWSWHRVAVALCRPTGAAVSARYDKIMRNGERRDEIASRAARCKRRRCLRCGCSFKSAHAGNRSCDPCLELGDDAAREIGEDCISDVYYDDHLPAMYAV